MSVSHFPSTVSGNLGGDTINIEAGKIAGGTIYGGGGYEYDTSLDGADSIEVNGNLQLLLIHANGGNDSLYINGSANITIALYGGQGTDLISTAGASAPLVLLVSGNRGSDKLILASSTNSMLNSTIYGSDSTGTLTGNDSIVLGAYTAQTSTVYGGAGRTRDRQQCCYRRSDH